MLRNFSANNFIAHDNKVTFASYLRALKDNPAKLASLLAIFMIPTLALGWWYYSVAMSVDAVAPLNTYDTSSDGSISSDPANISDIAPGSTSSSDTTEKIDMQIHSSTSNNSQTGFVEVNGQSIPIPADGSTHQVIQNDNSQTTVDINVDSDTSGTSTSRSSTNINLKSSSDTDVDIKSEEIR